MNKDFIELKQLALSFPERNFSLSVQDFAVARNQLTVIIGPSGSGKSTLLDVLSLIQQPAHLSSCRIDYHIQDHAPTTIQALWNDPKLLSQVKRNHFGYMFQQSFFLPELTIQKNLEVSLLLNAHATENTADHIAEFLSSSLFKKTENIKGNELAWECSGGQKQRLSLCRALIHNPDCIFLDEPTGDLDFVTAKVVFDYLKAWKEKTANRTVVMVSHDLHLACQYADNIYFIKDQKLDRKHKLEKTHPDTFLFNGQAMSTAETLAYLKQQL